jgi:REP element-mobilizing transposase RayT
MRSAQVTVFVHFVWATWDRLPLLESEIKQAIYRAIGAKCEELRADVIAIGGVEDHIHLLVRLPATLAVADLVKHVKGASSHLANFRVPDGGSFRWQGGYAAFSVSPEDLQSVITYIANQRQHHLSNTLEPDAELPPTDSDTVIGHASNLLPSRQRT